MASKYGENLPVVYQPPSKSLGRAIKPKQRKSKSTENEQRDDEPYVDGVWQTQEDYDAEKEAQNKAYERDNELKRKQAKLEADKLEQARKQITQNTTADAKAQIQRLKEQEKQRKVQEKINKAGGVEFLAAKGKALGRKRKKQMRKWKGEASFDKRPQVIQTLTKRKKGKRNSSIVASGITKILYPVKPKKSGRW